MLRKDKIAEFKSNHPKAFNLDGGVTADLSAPEGKSDSEHANSICLNLDLIDTFYDVNNPAEMAKLNGVLEKLQNGKVAIGTLEEKYPDIFGVNVSNPSAWAVARKYAVLKNPDELVEVEKEIERAKSASKTEGVDYKDMLQIQYEEVLEARRVADVAGKQFVKNLELSRSPKTTSYKREDVLISDAMAKKVMAALGSEVSGRYQPSHPKLKALNLKYAVVKWVGEKGEAQYFAIDRGRKHANLIGEGAFGAVKRAQDIQTHEEAVLKIQVIAKSNDPENDKGNIQTELDFINIMNAGNDEDKIDVKIIDRVGKARGRQVEFIMPLAKGQNLEKYYASDPHVLQNGVEDSLAIMQAYQLVKDKRIIHNDIKPANIHIDRSSGKPHAAIIDFGFALRRPENQTECKYAGKMGTATYKAPELYTNETVKVHSEKTDIYAFGIVLAQSLVPQTLLNPLLKVYALQRTPIRIPADADEVLIKKIELINAMMNKDPKMRPTVEQVTANLNQIKKLENEYMPYVALNKLLNRIHSMGSSYKALGSKHKDDMDGLIAKVDEINKGLGSSASKLKNIMMELDARFAESRTSYKPGLFSAKIFHENINKNPNHHHYTRFIALAMQEVYQNNALLQVNNVPEIKYISHAKETSPDVLLITRPKNDVYEIFNNAGHSKVTPK